MAIRDVILTVVVLGLLPVCFFRPWIGVLAWAWIGLMNPHRLTFGFATAIPFAQMIAIPTLAGVLLVRDKERRRIPWVRETWLLLTLWVVYTLTTVVALYKDEAWLQWDKVSKILLFTFIVLLFFQTRERLRYLLLVAALSIGFYGLKGGIWSIATGGVYQVLGPEDSFIGENTAIGLALNMVLPFLLYLAREEPRPWLRRLLLATFVFSIPAILFTYSRGAVVGLPVVLAMLFLRARRRLVGVVALSALAFFVVNYAPGQWFSRVETIRGYEQDESANQRLTSWRVAWRLALDHPFTGGGFEALAHEEVYERYGAFGGHSAHSIYFAVVGDHGFPGLILFVALILSCVASLVHLRWQVKEKPGATWLVNYCHMLEASLMAYAVSGAFLTMAYFDLFYYLVSFVILLRALARREGVAATEPPRRPVPVRYPIPLLAGR